MNVLNRGSRSGLATLPTEEKLSNRDSLWVCRPSARRGPQEPQLGHPRADKILACSPNPGLSKDAALSTSDGREPSRNEAPLKTIDLGFKQRYRSRREPETFRSSRKAMVAIAQQAIRMVGICHRYRSARADKADSLRFYSVSRPMGNAEDGARDRIRGCSAVVAGEIARAWSEANVDDDAGAQRKASAEPFEKGISRRCVPSRCEPAPPGVAGNTQDQNRLKTTRERSSALKREL